MDGFQACRLDDDAGQNDKVAAAISLMTEIIREKRIPQAVAAVEPPAVPKASFIRRLRSELHENFPATREIEQRLRRNSALRRIFRRP
jgi:hypothetical protein